MTTFIQTRFYDTRGQYTSVWLGFATEDISAAADQWKAFAAGYQVSGKGKCLWDSILNTRQTGSSCYLVPGEMDTLKAYLETIQNRSA